MLHSILNEMQKLNAKVEDSETRHKALESQVTHLTQMVQQRQPGALPSDTEVNPKGKTQCNAVKALRSGKTYGGEVNEEEHQENEEEVIHEQQQKESKEQEEDEKEGELGTDVVDSTLEKKSEKVLRRNRLNNSLLSTSQPSRFDPPPLFPMKKPKVRNTFFE